MPTKKAIKSVIRAIRNGDAADVRRMIKADPELTNSCASAPPNKDDGQSPLQIAFKAGRFAIADFLIDRGADVTFIDKSKINRWRAPVIHDSIRAAAFNMRVAYKGNAKTFAKAIAMLTKLLDNGADPNATDSYGNNCLTRALLDLRIQLTSIPLEDSAATVSHAVFDEDARPLLGVLLEYGADIHASNKTRESAIDHSRGTYFERFLMQAAGLQLSVKQWEMVGGPECVVCKHLKRWKPSKFHPDYIRPDIIESWIGTSLPERVASASGTMYRGHHLIKFSAFKEWHDELCEVSAALPS